MLKRTKENPEPKVKFDDLSKTNKLFPDSVLLPMRGFLSGVDSEVLTDDDGYGYLATETLKSDVLVKPSDFDYIDFRKKLPRWASHILWFEKDI